MSDKGTMAVCGGDGGYGLSEEMRKLGLASFFVSNYAEAPLIIRQLDARVLLVIDLDTGLELANRVKKECSGIRRIAFVSKPAARPSIDRHAASPSCPEVKIPYNQEGIEWLANILNLRELVRALPG